MTTGNDRERNVLVRERFESRLRYDVLSRTEDTSRETTEQVSKGPLLGLAIGKCDRYHGSRLLGCVETPILQKDFVAMPGDRFAGLSCHALSSTLDSR